MSSLKVKVMRFGTVACVDPSAGLDAVIAVWAPAVPEPSVTNANVVKHVTNRRMIESMVLTPFWSAAKPATILRSKYVESGVWGDQ